MTFGEDFANFLYRLNRRLAGGTLDNGFVNFYKEPFVSYLEENAKLVAKRDFKMNQIKPGCVYIQYFKSFPNSSMDSVRILTTSWNPVYINYAKEMSLEAATMAYASTRIPIYIASGLEMRRGWPQSTVVRNEEKQMQGYRNTSRKKYEVFQVSSDYFVPIQKDSMSLIYANTNGDWTWNGWNTTDLEVWELPASVLSVNVPSLNYPDGGF